MKTKRLLKKLARAFQVKPKLVRADSTLKELEVDSTGMVCLMVLLQKEFGIVPTMDELEDIEGVADIIQIVEANSAA